MGTITSRTRKDGTEGHTAQIRIKAGGRIIHGESQTFDRRPAAVAWLKKREAALAEPGALAVVRSGDPTLAEVIARYVRESRRALGSTKEQVLRTISAADIGGMRCSAIGSTHVLAFAQGLRVQPQTVGNYLSHLAAVFAVARPAWGYPLDVQAMHDARTVAKRLGATSKSRSRDRRPTLPELDQLLAHFALSDLGRANAIPMAQIVLFALFSTRRLAEITRITWADLDRERAEVMVRDMKHPGEKMGNDVRVLLPPEAMAVVLQQWRPGASGCIFPHNGDSISARFTRACVMLGIDGLHLHDLRHEGISRLFEMGWSIPRVATVSGHRSWQSLKRYTHIRQVGDKYAGWAGLPAMPQG